MRYRAIYSTDPPGAYSEFSADTDEDALAHCCNARHIYGDIVSLTEGGVAGVQRRVPL